MGEDNSMLRALRLNPRLNPVNIPKPGEIFYAQHHYDGGMYSNASRVSFRMQEDGSANAIYSHGERPALSSAQVRELFETGSTSPRRNVTLSKLTPEQERLAHQRMLDAVFGPSEHIGKTHRGVVVSDVLPFRQDDDEDLRGKVTFDES